MSKITITNNRPGGFGIPGGPVIAGGGGTLEVDLSDWETVKDHPVVKAWVDQKHLTLSGTTAEKIQAAPSSGEGEDQRMSALEVLAMATATDVPFMSFKAAASKLLGEKTPSKKDEIIAALEELATQP